MAKRKVRSESGIERLWDRFIEFAIPNGVALVWQLVFIGIAIFIAGVIVGVIG